MRTTYLTLLACLTFTTPLWAVTCGDTLVGGVHTLTADLICSGDGPALIVRDGAVLDLGGHAVRIGHDSDSYALIGVILDGQGATLLHGIVSAHAELSDEFGVGVAILVAGTGGHQVVGVCGCGSAAGIVVVSDWNYLRANWMSAEVGLAVHGHGNTLRQNTSWGLTGAQLYGWANHLTGNAVIGMLYGFSLEGHQNTFIRNWVDGGAFGLEVYGHGNMVLQNQVNAGITAHGADNRFIHNASFDDFWESLGSLRDTHGDCTYNLWVGNTGGHADPPCILEGRPLLSRK